MLAFSAPANLQTVTDTQKNTTSFLYGSIGNLTQQTDALGNVNAFTYDGNNKLTQTVMRTRSDSSQETLPRGTPMTRSTAWLRL